VSFVEDIAAAVDALGVERAGVVYGIALTHFESPEKRDEFLSIISGKEIGGGA
jgi:hypothetical protein